MSEAKHAQTNETIKKYVHLWEATPMVTGQGTTRIVFGKDSNGFIETTEGRPQEDEGAWRVYTSGYAVLGWDDLLAIGRWIAEHERRHDDPTSERKGDESHTGATRFEIQRAVKLCRDEGLLVVDPDDPIRSLWEHL